jgi:hypothetical protein
VAAIPLSADTVRLRGGKTVTGMFIGGDSKSVRVLLDSGQVSEIPLEQAVAVEFAPRTPPRPAPAAPSSSKPSASAPVAVTVPAGTTLNVRLVDGIEVDASASGQVFKAVVDDPVLVGGAIVGGIAGGGSGAAIGAAVGGVTGAAVASGGEEHLSLPAETRLQFQLTAAVAVRP